MEASDVSKTSDEVRELCLATENCRSTDYINDGSFNLNDATRLEAKDNFQYYSNVKYHDFFKADVGMY